MLTFMSACMFNSYS